MKFYHLSKDFSFQYIDYSKDVDWQEIKCSEFEGHQRAGDRIGDLDFELKGVLDREFYWTFLSELVVTENLVDILKSDNIFWF
jgi:hypothetical protein